MFDFRFCASVATAFSDQRFRVVAMRAVMPRRRRMIIRPGVVESRLLKITESWMAMQDWLVASRRRSCSAGNRHER